MFVCPKCEEEIPSKVKKTTEECPFCHEPWPAEVTEEEAAAAAEPPEKHPEGWGDEFKPSAGAKPGTASRAEPAKSKTWMYAVGGVVAIGVVVGLYFALAGGGGGDGGGGKGGKGDGAAGGVSEAEIGAIDGWYKDVHKKFNEFLGDICSVHHQRGYKYNSHFHKRVQTKTVGGKKVQVFDFVLKIQPAKGAKAQGKLNMFACPVRIAEIHRDHPLVIEAKIWEHRQTFGGVYNKADIEIKGKMVGHLDAKYRKIGHNVVLQNRDGFAFSKMKSLPKEPRYLGYRTLSTPMKFNMGKAAKSFTLSNLTWNKIKPGRYIQGTWRMELRSNEFRKQLKDWHDGCFGFRKGVAKLDKPKGKHTTHLKLTRVERSVTKDICAALQTLAEATKGDKIDGSALNKARAALNAARAKWNKEIFGFLNDLATKTKSAIRSKPL